MKKRVLITLVSVAVISLALLLFYQSKETPHQPVETPVATPVPNKQTPSNRIISQADVDAVIKEQRAERKKQESYAKKMEADPDFAESELQRLIAENPQAKKMYRLFQAATFPIEFHGKIIDKKDQPIPDVEIKYSIGPAYGMGQPIHQVTTSDYNGRYIIKGEGAMVSINSITKPDYQFPESQQHFFTVTESGRPLTWRDHAANNPYITRGHNGNPP